MTAYHKPPIAPISQRCTLCATACVYFSTRMWTVEAILMMPHDATPCLVSTFLPAFDLFTLHILRHLDHCHRSLRVH